MTDATSNALVLLNPPVVETILTVQFSDLQNWSSLHHGLFFQYIGDRYPEFEQIGEIAPIIESFPPLPMQRRFKLEFTHKGAEGCASYFNPRKTELIRVQKNRFAYHWIRSEDGTYPHFTENSKNWIHEFETFRKFCSTADVGEVVPVLCEVQYLNHLIPREGEELCELMQRALGLDLGRFELTTLNRTYPVEDNQGRLYAEIQTAFDENGTQFLEFKLTCRIHHEEGELFSTMQKAHDLLITLFKNLTTDGIRKSEWGSNE